MYHPGNVFLSMIGQSTHLNMRCVTILLGLWIKTARRPNGLALNGTIKHMSPSTSKTTRATMSWMIRSQSTHDHTCLTGSHLLHFPTTKSCKETAKRSYT